MKGILERIRHHASQQTLGRKPRVAIGCTDATSIRFRQSIEETRSLADVMLVGDVAAGQENSINTSGDPSVIAARLFDLSLKHEVDAIVRGQVDYVVFHAAFRKACPALVRDVMCVSLLRSRNAEWLLTPTVHHDDSSVEGRCYLARQAARICSQLGLIPRIGILAADDPNAYAEQIEKNESIARAIVDDYARAKAIEKTLREERLDATVYPLRIDQAITECNIVVPMDGVIGNFIHRSLAYIGEVETCGSFSLTRKVISISLTRKVISIETSRFNDAFGTAIQLACAATNLGEFDIAEYSG